MSKRMRFILAIITGLITVALAYQISFALPTDIASASDQHACTTKTRNAYEDLRLSTSVEQTPAYQLTIAEAFLSQCANPLHVQAVAKQAARSALDAGQTDLALKHFEVALENGAALTEQEQLDYVLALWLNDKPEHAWAQRDGLIQDWLDRAAQIADVTSINVRDGIIHKIVFEAPRGEVQAQTHWLAQPHDQGWPAAISQNADPALAAFLAFRMGPSAHNMQDLTLVQCRGRKTAARTFGQFDDSVAEDTAIETLKAYLRAPQSPTARDVGQPANACYAIDRLFVPLR